MRTVGRYFLLVLLIFLSISSSELLTAESADNIARAGVKEDKHLVGHLLFVDGNIHVGDWRVLDGSTPQIFQSELISKEFREVVLQVSGDNAVKIEEVLIEHIAFNPDTNDALYKVFVILKNPSNRKIERIKKYIMIRGAGFSRTYTLNYFKRANRIIKGIKRKDPRIKSESLDLVLPDLFYKPVPELLKRGNISSKQFLKKEGVYFFIDKELSWFVSVGESSGGKIEIIGVPTIQLLDEGFWDKLRGISQNYGLKPMYNEELEEIEERLFDEFKIVWRRPTFIFPPVGFDSLP